MLQEPCCEQMLTVKDVSDFLSVSQRTVWRWVTLGIFPKPVTMGMKSPRWRASEIQAYIDNPKRVRKAK